VAIAISSSSFSGILSMVSSVTLKFPSMKSSMGRLLGHLSVSVLAQNVTVRSPCLAVILVLEFSDRGVSQIGSQPDVSIRKSS